VENPPEGLGKDLLIAVDDTPGSLEMIRAVASALPDPEHTQITLMHYLAPVFWEYGGGNPEAARYLDEQAHEKEHAEQRLTQRYFDKATSILAGEGVNPDHVRTEMNWSADNVAQAILSELQAGKYSGVVIGQDHHHALSRMLHLDPAHVLRRHAENIIVWVVGAAIPD
jgi:hypothetical protein